MATAHERISEQFYKWESRGRGYQVWPNPVSPEPAFVPWQGHSLSEPEFDIDDGRRPSFLGSLFRNVGKQLNPQPPPIPEEPESEPEPEILCRDSLVELQLSLSDEDDYPKEVIEQFLFNLHLCHEPIAFELLGVSNRVTVQFSVHPEDAPGLRQQIDAYFPEIALRAKKDFLQESWDASEAVDVAVVDFGLAHEFMLPLATCKVDPFIGIIGTLSELRAHEIGLLQVIFQPVREPWAESIFRSVTHADGKPFFVNSQELVDAAQNKIAKPLFAAVARIAVRGENQARTLRITRDLASSLRVFANSEGNHLIPLNNDGYDFQNHIDDVLSRQTRRSGMLLSTDELVGFVHLPSSAVCSPALKRDSGKTKAAPESVRQEKGLLLGQNVHLDEALPVRLNTEQRLRHIYMIGASGTGKSSLLFNLIRQDIENGEGVGVLDPHGDLIERILGIIPPARVEDVVLVDPSDPEYSVGFNILSAHSDLEKNLLASDLVSIFQRLSTSWGDQLGSVLQNACLAFLESSEKGTLSDLRRFLIEPGFRDKFLNTVQDSDIVYYWRKAFPQLGGNKSIGSVITRLNSLLSPKPVRHMISQSENRLDFTHILDTGKIFLAKLPEGQIGKENSYLIGSLLVAKFQQLVMGRQAQKMELRRPFWLYIDEFQSFIAPSMAQILSGARKYGFGMILAHQELHHLERNSDVKSAVLSNPYTRIVFRVGDSDARVLENGFASFEAKSLQNLENFHAICRVGKADGDFNLTVSLPQDPDLDHAQQIREAVIAASRAKYATRRSDVEAALLSKLDAEDAEPALLKPRRVSKPKVEPPIVAPAVEIPKATVPEIKEVAAVEAVVATPIVVAEIPKAIEPTPDPVTHGTPQPRDLGRGGELRDSIQKRLESAAHSLGFRVQIEKQLSKKSNEAADLLLQKGEIAIAIEICVATTVDHEFGNIKKCLARGLNRIASVSASPEKLKQIALAVHAGLGAEEAAKVGYYLPDDFITELKRLAAEIKPKEEPPPVPGKRVIRGWNVNRHGPKLSPEERDAKEKATHKVVSEATRPEP
jgi:hypothetical protein